METVIRERDTVSHVSLVSMVLDVKRLVGKDVKVENVTTAMVIVHALLDGHMHKENIATGVSITALHVIPQDAQYVILIIMDKPARTYVIATV